MNKKRKQKEPSSKKNTDKEFMWWHVPDESSIHYLTPGISRTDSTGTSTYYRWNSTSGPENAEPVTIRFHFQYADKPSEGKKPSDRKRRAVGKSRAKVKSKTYRRVKSK